MSAITVKELREALDAIKGCDNLPVYLQIDPEGNGYLQVSGIEVGMAKGNSYSPDRIAPPEAAENPEEWCLEPGEYKTNCLLVYP